MGPPIQKIHLALGRVAHFTAWPKLGSDCKKSRNIGSTTISNGGFSIKALSSEIIHLFNSVSLNTYWAKAWLHGVEEQTRRKS